MTKAPHSRKALRDSTSFLSSSTSLCPITIEHVTSQLFGFVSMITLGCHVSTAMMDSIH